MVRVLAALLCAALLASCVSTAIGVTGAVVGAAVGVTGAVVGAAVDVVTPDGDDEDEDDDDR
jgi:hypothetical protein